jgi:predicted DNA-binding transcriptional regulator AlpA
MPQPDCMDAIEKLTAKIAALEATTKVLLEEVMGRGEDRLLNVREAARFLGKTERAIRALVYRRQLPAVHIGNRLAFRRSEIAPRR